jgi:hypothetical protein
MRTTVDIDRYLLQRLRDAAHEQGLPLKVMLNRALRRGLDPNGPETTPYVCPTFSMGSPLRPLDKALALADALEDEEVTRRLAHRE